ncbi:MAG: alpha/beta hydrolase-fold protein [Bacteroidota bacterium]
MNKQANFIFLFALFFTFQLSGQTEKDFTIGKEYVVKSEILGQDRPILVYLPPNYDKKEKAYPVMYLLDGRGNFHHTTACVAFLARNGRIPEMIVIGVPNTDDRTRDLTPETTIGKERFPTSGGAENMLSFIEKELIPYVNSKYRTETYKTLVGHSFGGLFVTHTLLHHPEIFNSYISISPSLWWDDQKMVKEQTDTFFEQQQDLVGHLYMTMGDEGGSMLGGAWKLVALLEEKSPQDFKWEFDLMEEETHGSIPHRSTYKGLEFIFSDWNLKKQEEFIVAEGIVAYEEKIAKIYGFEQEWDERTLSRMGQMLSSKGHLDKAVPVFQKATVIEPKSERAWFLYGESLAKSGQKEKAIENLEKVLKINPKNMQAIVTLRSLGTAPESEIDNMKLSEEELKKYEGTYDVEIGLTAIMSVKDGALKVSGKGIPEETLFPIAEHTFFLSALNSKLIFNLKNDEVIGFKVESENGTFEAIKK